MCRKTRNNCTVALSIILAVLLRSAFGQTECPARSSPVLNDFSLEEAYGGNCTSVSGDLVIGYSNCSAPCNITSLAPLNNLQSISGSLVIQCCHMLEDLSGVGDLTEVTGTLRLYYNRILSMVRGFGAVRVLGNLEISQNPNLTTITGLSSLEIIRGYLQIDHNQKLVNLDGLSSVRLLSGAKLVAGHALNILYNPSLTDLQWLLGLSLIEFGTVHVEGNTALCYAGYPQWTVGGYLLRPPAGDQGVDWRRLLGQGVPKWQYSWVNDGSSGYPTLIIQNNAGYSDCETASCHDSCEEGAGCLGPVNPALCGSCSEGFCDIGTTPTTASCDPTPIPYWPPTELPYSVIFGIVFAICGLILLGLVVLAFCVFYRICKRLRAGRKDTFNVNEEMEMVGVELRRRDSGIIATNTTSLNRPIRVNETSLFNEVRPDQSRGGNVVLTSHNISYESPTTTNIPSLSSPASPSSSASISFHSDPPTAPQQSIVITAPHERGASLHAIAEEMEREEDDEEDEVGSGEETRDDSDLVRSKPVRRLYKQDTLTRLQRGRSAHVQMAFPRNQLKIKKEIGTGNFGTVFYGEARKLVAGEKKTSVVVKQLKENASKQEEETFLRPVEAMSSLLHQNVLSLLGVCVDGAPIMILMEYCSHGNLKTYLVRKRRETASFKEGGRLLAIACQMASGLAYLHSKSIAHNDFAARSCLVSDSETVKLGDYGLTRVVFEEDYYSRGGGQKAWPVRWMAPEQMIVRGSTVLDSHPVSITANIWSFGIALWEVATFAQWPYYDVSNEEVIDSVQSSQQCSLENPFQSSDPLFHMYDIMEQCWRDAKNRPTMEEIVRRLEELRDEVARNTPSSRKRISISLTHSPKTAIKATPTGPRPQSVYNSSTLPKATPPGRRPHSVYNGTLPKSQNDTLHHNTLPKATPTATPPEHHSAPLAEQGKPRRAPAVKRTAPRRQAPSAPDSGTLTRGSPKQIPINTHQQDGDHQLQHPLATKTSTVETERQQKSDLAELKDQKKTSEEVMVKLNPSYRDKQQEGEREVEMTQMTGEEEEIKNGSEQEALIFMNREAEEEEEKEMVNQREEGKEEEVVAVEEREEKKEEGDEEKEEQEEEEVEQEEKEVVVVEEKEEEKGKGDEKVENMAEVVTVEVEITKTEENRERGKWEFEEETQEWADEEFILEPPIDFSQPGLEEEVDFQPSNDDTYDLDVSQCTSIDDFEPITTGVPPLLPPPVGNSPISSKKKSRKSHAVDVDGKQKKKKKKKKRRDLERADGTQASPLLSYHSRRKIKPIETVGGGGRGGGEGRGGGVDIGCDVPIPPPEFRQEEEGEENDAMYRRPTGQISKALLKRAPSWGKSGQSDPEELPNVVYDDEVAALIW